MKLKQLMLLGWLLAAFNPVNAECTASPGVTERFSAGWGIDLHNQRFQPRTDITRENASQLKLKWAYGFSNSQPRSWPLVTEDTIFIGDAGFGLVALDRETGCTRWVFKYEGQISSAVLHARVNDKDILLFTDRTSGVVAIDAAAGKLVWQASVPNEPVPFYSGTPVVHGDKVFVPISSLEIALTANPLYGCCTTSGGMAALDLASGDLIWYRPTIEAEAVLTGRHFLIVSQYGPSGAPVWGSALLDTERGMLYYGTGQNYSHPTTSTSDAIFAVESNSGKVSWTKQFTTGDAYNIACGISLRHPNCPKPVGPDLDFGAPPILLTTKAGRQLVVVGQKSSDIRALDPDTGEVVWHRRIGRGGALGGIHWGMAASEAAGLLFVPISDFADHGADGQSAPGLYALDIATGELRWSTKRQSRCEAWSCGAGLSAAITAAPGLVVAGSLDGFLEIYAATDGHVLWAEDTWKDYQTVNGVKASGGAIDAHGPMLADDLLMVSSGYGSFGQKAGNVFLVFQLLPGNNQ